MKRFALLLGMAAITPRVAQGQVPTGVALEAPTAPPPPTQAPTTTPSSGPTPDAADAKAPPGDQYFVDAVPPATAAPSEIAEPAPFEPPLPPEPGFEPPAPPEPRHVAPQSSLWLGARVGWFVPFGNAWARATPVSDSANAGYTVQGVPWRDYVSSGPV